MTDLIIRKDGCLGRITLNRPEALNALSYDMVLAIDDTLKAWQTDNDVSSVLIEGAGDRAFCAGGDIRTIYDIGKSEPGWMQNYWRREYELDYLISRYPKPYIAIMDGYTMGGGVGISAHGSHRIVTERSVVSMPEVVIGFLPDVGGTWLLSRAPGKTGLYCGLTAARMNPADAIYTGFADVFAPSGQLEGMITELREEGDVDTVIKRYSSVSDHPSFLEHNRAEIDAYFSHETLPECLEALEKADTEFSRGALKMLNTHSPFAVSCAFYAIARSYSFTCLTQCLEQEYAFAHRSVYTADLYEGIRAAVVDKDRNPRWEHANLKEVDPEAVRQMFAPLGEEAFRI